jgi:alkanesulfonate monooxygenase SsuD/methylene tetrahydromethanopterin reductase-like flavin-dependent oxidoreductase (luciferase family)
MFEMRFDLSGCGAGLDESGQGLLELGPLAERLGYGLALFQGSQQSLDSIRRCIAAFKDAGGNAAQVPIGRFIVVGESDEAARQAARPAAQRLTANYRRGGDQLRRRILTEDELDAERFLDDVAIVGGPATVAARIAALHDELGFGSLQLVTGFLGNLPQEHVVRTLELFAEEVRPRFERALQPVANGT